MTLQYAQGLFRKDIMELFIKDYLYVLEVIINNKRILVKDISLTVAGIKSEPIVWDEFEMNF